MILRFNYIEELLSLSSELVEAGRLDFALAVSRRLMARFPGDSRGHLMAGGILSRLNRLPEAKNTFRELIKIDKYLIDAYLQLGVLLAQDLDQEPLLALVHEIDSLFPGNKKAKDFITAAKKPHSPLRQLIEVANAPSSTVTTIEHSQSGMRPKDTRVAKIVNEKAIIGFMEPRIK